MASADMFMAPPVVRRLEYTPLPVTVPNISLSFQLDVEVSADGKRVCEVVSETHMLWAPGVETAESLVMNAELTQLLEPVKVNGVALAEGQYVLDATAETLTIFAAALPAPSAAPTPFVLTTRSRLLPEDNLQLQGLFCSSGIFCSQMEAEGYRRMVPSFDRPDVLSRYDVRVEGDLAKCPVLLSNGNCVEKGAVPGSSPPRHYSVWQDPFPKPSYLFALVAGDLAKLSGSFTTRSGREVAIDIYCDAPAKVGELGHAMESIKLAMTWDEEQFGREYDLDIFNIVAVGDFNMGAMENKSLNVFNSKCVLGVPETATDATLRRIQGIIAHEYFHNWTGNRVTCRDWFQLTLKEGLTVYRDIRFTSDQSDAAVKRIQDVKTMRQMQMPEDSGPLAHPIRPEEYVKMDNFYTRTVYRKGAEVIRMYETLLGRAGFRRGTDLYFQRFDGMAVTCDDFLEALADANDPAHADAAAAAVEADPGMVPGAAGLLRSDAFRRWYSQAGTPTLTVETFEPTATANVYRLVLSQATPPTPGQATKAPVLVPVSMGLLDRKTGASIQVKQAGSDSAAAAPFAETVVLTLSEGRQEFLVAAEAHADGPVLSILRGWSAPVKVEFAAQTSEDLSTILKHDPDSFTRYEACARLALKTIVAMAAAAAAAAASSSSSDPMDESPTKRRKVENSASASGGGGGGGASEGEDEAAIVAPFLDAWRFVFEAAGQFAAAGQQHLQALMLNLPSTVEVLNEMDQMDVAAVAAARGRLGRRLAAAAGGKALAAAYSACRVDPASPYALSVECEGRRVLSLTLLSFWLRAPPPFGVVSYSADDSSAASPPAEAMAAVLAHFEEATNMTDEAGALGLLARSAALDAPERAKALAAFEAKYRDHREAIDAWFTGQSACGLPGARARLEALMTHPAFSLTNPNKVRSVFGLATTAPEVLFDPDVLGLLGDVITQIDATNANLAAGLTKQLAPWRRLPEGSASRAAAQAVLERVRDREGCSKNAGEVAAAALA